MAASRFVATFANPVTWRRLPCGAALLVAAVLGASVGARAEPPQPTPQPQARVIVDGEGSVRVAPDYAQVNAGVTTRAKTAKQATAANSKLMSAVTAALVNAGIGQKDIQTSRFSVEPVYVSQGANTESKLTGFSASNQVNVRVRQIAKVGEILDRLVTAGATNVGGVSFLHSDLSRTLDNAREAAIADARRKAEVYAHAAGLTLGRVAWITEESGYAPPFPVGAPRALAAAVPISPGEDTLRVQITVGFEIAR
jgi:uncharacterized protein